MKAYELPVKVTPDGNLDLPDALMKMLPRSQIVRVIILVNEPRDIDEQSAWSRLTAEQFLAGYCEGDAIYDIDNRRLDTDAGNDTTTLDFHLGGPVVYKV